MFKTLPFIGMFLWLLAPNAGSALDIISPTDRGVVLGDTARFIITCGDTPEIAATIDTQSYEISWKKELYGDRWVGDLELPFRGVHTVVLEGTCGGKNTSGEVRFDNLAENSVEIAEFVISRYFFMNKAEKLDWNWGPAIFLYPLLKIAPKSARKDEYINYIKKYHQRHLDKGLPKIQWADHCPSALSAFDLAVEHGDDFAWSSVETVMDWIRNAERNALGSIDHLGYDNIKSLWFPGSIWVDSLVMWVLITVKYAIHTHDEDLLAFGLEQPFIFADKLRNPETGLFFHAWNIGEDRPFPSDNAHWLRGNGWVLVAIAEILSLIGEEHERYPELAEIFVDLAQATLPHRQPSGYWDTVLDSPGYAYEESSGSALIAVGYAKGVRLGLLSEEFWHYAEDTFQAITARMKYREDPDDEDIFYTVEEISKGTNPLDKLGYKMIGKDRNISYGVGAFLLLANELVEPREDPVIEEDAGVDGSPDPDPDIESDDNHDLDTDPDINQDTETNGGLSEDGSVEQDPSSSSSCQCNIAVEPQTPSLFSVASALF